MKAEQDLTTFRLKLLSDIRSNRRHWRSIIFVILFRFAHFTREGPLLARLFRLPFAIIYRIISEIFLTVDVPIQTTIGPGLRLRHGFGLVVHKNAIIGAGVTLRQGVTIGVRHTGEETAPVLSDGVDVGANAIILGAITIGAPLNPSWALVTNTKGHPIQ